METHYFMTPIFQCSSLEILLQMNKGIERLDVSPRIISSQWAFWIPEMSLQRTGEVLAQTALDAINANCQPQPAS